MQTSFRTTILGFGNNAGIEVPAEALASLGAGKRPPVLVTIGDYSYSSTVGVMGGRALISLSKAHRDASGLRAGDAVTVALTLVTGQRQVDVPVPLRAALESAGLETQFAALAYSKRKEFARRVAEAKTEATRDRRIETVLASLT